MSLEADYSIIETLRETPDGTRWLRAKNKAGHSVTLKVLTSEPATAADVHRLRNAFEVGGRLAGTSVLLPLALGTWGGHPAIILEDFDGQPLDRQLGAPMRVDRFFAVADGITRALAEVHAKNVVHRDIKPRNILVSTVSGEVKLTGLTIASLLPAERGSVEEATLIEGTLAYMSPEQTGRMNRQVDQRSDLYSLGVTFYELLTGRLPFEASDALEWVHCHVARVPPAPAEVAPTIPKSLSAIVMKLLSKLADERYQTALGLRRDLTRCRELLASGAGLEPFPLGEHDAPDRLQLPQRLYGRKTETDALLAVFERVVHGGTSEVVLVSGPAGSGKSSLVRELGEPVVRERGLFAAGKFDQLTHDIPHATLVQAFEELVRETLASSEERLQAWRQRLLDALGRNARVIVEVIPQIELVIGPQPAVPSLTPGEARNRFDATFRRFVGAFATAARPLVLFLDDLQWADPGSLRLIEEIVTDEQIEHVLFVGAWRESEVPPSHPVRAMFERIGRSPSVVTNIPLAPLTLEPMLHLVQDALRAEPERARPLAAIVHEKTGGNPFFAVQFLTSLHEDRLLLLDPVTRDWNWDIARIEQKAVTDNVVDLLLKKLSALPPEAREVLKTAACIGNRVPSDILAKAHGSSEDETRKDAWEAMRESLILRAGDAYVFAHDRIQEAVYSLIPDEARAAAHLRIGRLLVSQMTREELEDRVFEVVSQLNRGAALITDAEEKKSLCRLNALAGSRARTTIAYASARSYLAMATNLLAPDAWTTSYEETFSLYLERSECEYLVGEFEEADPLFSVLLEHARTNSDRARACILRMRLYQLAGKPGDGVTVMIEALRRMGMSFPETDEALWAALEAEQREVSVNLRGRRISELVDAPVVTDPDVRAMIGLLVAGMPCAHIGRPKFFPLIVVRGLNQALLHGNTEDACFAYIAYGTLLVSTFGDIPAAFEFSEMSLRLNEKFGDVRLRGVLLYLHAHFIHSWRRPFKAVLPLLEKVFPACLEVGELAFAAYHGFHSVWLSVERGEPLEETLRISERYGAYARESHNVVLRHAIWLEQQFVKCLAGTTRQPTRFDDGVFTEAEFLEFARVVGTMTTFFHLVKQFVCFTYGQYGEALEHADLAAPTLVTVIALPVEATHHFYRALTLAAVHRTSPPAQQVELARALAEELKKLAHWAESCPENYRNRYALVAAEAARIEGRELDAMRLYEEAIRSARENGFVQNEALGFELASDFYREQGRELIADTYLGQACARYARWGAHGKVRQLEQLHPQLVESTRGPGPSEGLRAGQLDLLTVFKASQAISGQIVLDELIDTLMRVVLESAGAQTGSLLLYRGNALGLAAVARVDSQGVSVLRKHGDALSATELPTSIINYVRRTREHVRLGNATRLNPFAADEYLVRRQSKSVLCLPILRQAELIGLLYLENDLVTDAFTAGRLAVLELLAGQAAISLEIANLVETERHAREALESSESRFRRVFESNMIGLLFGDLSGGIAQANDYLLQMLGYTRADVEAGHVRWKDMTPPEWQAVSAAAVEQVRSLGRCRPFEKEYLHKDGTRVPVLVGASLFPGRNAETISFILDLTERKRAEAALHRSEENLRQAQKMEAIGNLAGGIAHDFNNLLSLILGYSSLLANDLIAEDPARTFVDEISEAAIRAGALTKQLLAFGRKQMLQPRVVTLNSILIGVERMLRRLIGEDIELIVIPDPRLGTTRVDPGQVEQIIMNLAVNSRDAMPQGGKLTLETANVELDEKYAAEHEGVRAGPHVMLAVTDTGIGMDEATQARMYEPFFTTKEVGKGTGLGLATVFGIVQQSGGNIGVHSAPGRGTCFKIYFPRTDAVAADVHEALAPRGGPLVGVETILLVEDDEHVRTLVRTILRQFGYGVLEAQSGGDALLICEDRSQTIHLLLTDVIMPRMSGAQLAERLRPLRPDMKVLFMSGYADNSIAHQGFVDAGVAFLQKPITLETLTRKVREVLDEV